MLLLMVTVPSAQSGSPPQPEKSAPFAGNARRVTTTPLSKVEEQVLPQFIPLGLLMIFPLPLPPAVIVPISRTVRVDPAVGVLRGAKVAVQDRLLVMVTVPSEQSVGPLQPVNVYPCAGTACNRTEAPLGKIAEQLVPQEIPAGLLATEPFPRMETVRSKFCRETARAAPQASGEYGDVPAELNAFTR